MKTLNRCLAIILMFTTASCAVVSQRPEIAAVDHRAPVKITTPVKAHLKDGSTVVYPNGVTVTPTALEGPGSRHPITLASAVPVSSVPLDQIVGMETYRTAVNDGETAVLTTLGSAVGVAATLVAVGGLAIALFGSCPTVYSGDSSVEEAELFSSSIAPLFEGRDLDLLRAQPDATGLLSLDIRNEALETHYLNHLQLVEVQHGAREVVVPEAQGALLALSDVRPARTAVDRGGRDVTRQLAKADNIFYVAERASIDRATLADMDDWIDVTVPVESGASSAALAFRMRNSLLNTVLLYDVMLAPAGAGALGWMGGDLRNISTAVELGRWHQRRSGLHISVWQDGAYREVVRVPDSGPIAWHDVAAVVPVPAGETTLRLRLSFLTDHWRIDQLGISMKSRVAPSRTIPLSGVRGSAQQPEPDALANMKAPDERYLQTHPGHRFYADFQTGPVPAIGTRSFLLSSQGYYTEWIRGSWIQNASVTTPFAPTDGAILTALRKWSGTRESFERRFTQYRVPVR